MKCKALPDRVLVHNLKHGERMVSGIIILDDNKKDHGIKARWAQVYDVGSEISDVKVGEWVLISHGRWSRGIKIPLIDNPQSLEDFQTIHQVDYPDGVLAVTEEEPEDTLINSTQKY